MHHDALWRRVWDSVERLDHPPPVLPTNTLYAVHILSEMDNSTCFKVDVDKATFGPVGPQVVVTFLPLVAFHETCGIPALSHQLPGEFLRCFACPDRCYVLIVYCIFVSGFPSCPYCHRNQDT